MFGRIKTQNMKTEKIKLFLVDDDALFLKSLEMEFMQHADFIIETFATGELCLKNLLRKPDVIILDYCLNSIDKNAMNGMEILDKIKKHDPDIPVVMLSVSADKIEMGKEFMNHDAFDYAVKNKTAFDSLQKILTSVFRYRKNGKEIALVYDKGEIPFQLTVFSC
jgi:DNA-binding NtrC family response regulator